MTRISKQGSGIVFENDYFIYEIGYNAKVLSFIDKADGKNYISNSESPYFCYLNTDGKGNVANPINMEYCNEKLIFGFTSGSYLAIKPEVKETYISFEVIDTYKIACYNLIFGNTVVDYPIVEGEDTFGLSTLAMRMNTKSNAWPSYKEKKAGATVYSEVGLIGAKIAILGAHISKHVEFLKNIANDIPRGDAPVAYGVGGPWARENPGERGDYIIISAAKPEQLANDLKMYTDLNVDQLDFHKGAPFRQGDFFFFTDETGEASAFKEKMVSQLTPHGIKAGLHTYSFYIDPNASGLLSDPKWQKQLLPAEKYVLAEDIDENAVALLTEENTDIASRITGYRALASEYVLIDEELIKISALDIGENGFANLTRGIASTKPAAHKKGAKIYRIASYYSGLCPIIGSELFYEVARRTAKAYNEGGFGMIYFDALDGISRHVTDKETGWYYAATFVNEVLKNTITTPIAEMSYFLPPFYLARGRAGAWDHPRRGYKLWNTSHVISNKKMLDNYLCAILGWYNLYPIAPPAFPPSTHVKYEFFDDIDHMASLAVAYDYGMVYQNIAHNTLALPAVKRNTDRYAFYNKLRKQNYFPDSIRKQIREGKYEYALTTKGEGEYTFVEKAYAPKKVINIDDKDFNTTTHSNPFGAQKPFVRFEAYPVTTGKDPIVAIELDETKELKGQTLRADYPVLDPLKAAGHYGVHVKVLGNGSATDAAVIRIQGVIEGDHNACDYFIPLNFNGWKDFYLVDLDNREYDDYAFEGIEQGGYLALRGMTNFGRLQSVQIYLAGECDGVKMSSIELCEWEIRDVVDPTVKIGDDALTFKCTLHGGEYIEYADGSEAMIYDKDGNSRPVDAVVGSITAPAGEFNATVTRANVGDSNTKVRLTFGFTGNEIH